MDVNAELSQLENERNALYDQFKVIEEKIQRLSKVKSLVEDIKTNKFDRKILQDELKKIPESPRP